MNPKIATTRVSLLLLLFTLCAVTALAQTPSFTYQGRLSDGGTAASGTYDLQFTLWDALSGGTQQPQPAPLTVTRTSVLVTGGIFTVPLDFGATAFPGAARFLEISARLTGAPTFTTLAPRQQITSTPYAIRSLNASTADAVIVNGVPGGSGNYVQNTTTPQAGNFNISGNGTVGSNLVVNGNVMFDNQWRTETTTVLPGPVPGPPNLIGGFLGTGSGGLTPGNRATAGVVGATIGGGGFNGTITFPSAGTGAGDNSNRVTDWFGTVGGGFLNRAGNDDATLDNTRFATVGGGQSNTASGTAATVGGGIQNTASNTYATVGGGVSNSASGNRATVGGGAGNSASGVVATVGGGGDNAASGESATVAGGESNTALGAYSFAAGRQAKANHQGTFVWADSTGLDFTSTANDQFLIRASGGVGIGTTTPTTALEVSGIARSTRTGVAPQYIQLNGGDSGSIKLTAQSTVAAEKILFIQNLSAEATPGVNNSIQFQLGATASPSTKMTIDQTGSVGIGTTNPPAKLTVKGPGTIDVLRVESPSGLSGLVVRDDRIVAIGVLSSLEAASTHVCVDSVNRLSFCTSSLRYKQQVAPYSAGLNLIRRLRPISFTWKGNGTRDFGLAAEDVAKVEPLLVTHNDKGEIQGVKYDQLNVVLINAIKQQQDQIEGLRTANAALNARLRSVERIVRKRVGSSRRRR